VRERWFLARAPAIGIIDSLNVETLPSWVTDETLDYGEALLRVQKIVKRTILTERKILLMATLKPVIQASSQTFR